MVSHSRGSLIIGIISVPRDVRTYITTGSNVPLASPGSGLALSNSCKGDPGKTPGKSPRLARQKDSRTQHQKRQGMGLRWTAELVLQLVTTPTPSNLQAKHRCTENKSTRPQR